MTEIAFEASGTYELYTSERLIARLAAPGVEGYVLGRSDAGSPYVPDVDLADYGALESGVSRRHAALVRFRNLVQIVDLGSVNGTFLNGERLQPDQPYSLQAGDVVQLGTLNLSLIKIK
jgi:pSer/pThr/pTyr-binding forkhead associated (FHA) protein